MNAIDLEKRTYHLAGIYSNGDYADFTSVRTTWAQARALAVELLSLDSGLESVRVNRPAPGADVYVERA